MTRARDIADFGSVSARLDTLGGSEGALSNRNIIINGAMQVAQRATSATGVGSGFAYPTLDRFKIVPSTSGRATMTQTADGPAGFANCLKLECTTADTSIAATEYFILRQSFEGQDLQQFKKGTSSAEKITVSFYVKGNAAATYTCELDDADNTRHNSQEFSVTTDWTRVILTFDGDTTGAFDDDNARSLNLDFWLHAGSNYTGGTHTDNVWHTTTNQRVGDSQTSFFDSTSRTFFITGIQMEVGDTATDFEHRTFGDELVRCQRYFERMDDEGNSSVTFGVGYNESTSQGRGMIFFKTIKRVDPTISISAVSSFCNVSTGSTAAASALTFDSQLPWGCRYICTSSNTSLVDGGASILQRFQNDATIEIDAEL